MEENLCLAAYGTLLPLDEQGDPCGKAIGLWASPITIGRRRTCQVVVDDCRASARHCELTFDGGTWLIRDLGSTNGTWVNGQDAKGIVRLRSGDTIRVGRQHFAIQFADEQN